MIDAGEHLGILHHVVRTLPIHEHMREEALSEGLVLLAQAANSYDSTYGIPPHYWIAKKLRWGLLNWRIMEERKHINHNTILLDDLEVAMPAIDIALELREIVKLAQRLLPPDEYLALMGAAFGLQMKELSHVLHANGKQVKALQQRARQTLRLL